MKGNKEPKLEKRKIKDLQPYPRQQDYFNDLPDEELVGLAAAMKTGGVPPIEILPRNKVGLPVNTILRGHQRLRAAKLNGETELVVLVRYDLGNADAAAIEREFLSDNHHRRHESTISRARVAIRLMELEARKELAGVPDPAKRDRVGKIIGMSGRNLDRYLNVLNAPRVVQDAFEQKRLSLVLAGRVGTLPQRKQAEVAKRIEGGESPTKAVREMLGAPKRQPLSPGAAIVALANALGQAEDGLLGRMQAVSGEIARHESALRGGKDLIEQLLSVVDSQPGRDEEE